MRIRPEPAILALLRAGRLGEACAIAMRRLRASGLAPLPGVIRGRGLRDGDWTELDGTGRAGLDPRRLAAALLIPVSDSAVNHLFHLATRGEDAQPQETAAATAAEGD
jgi:CRISPR-associated protein Csx17